MPLVLAVWLSMIGGAAAVFFAHRNEGYAFMAAAYCVCLLMTVRAVGQVNA